MKKLSFLVCILLIMSSSTSSYANQIAIDASNTKTGFEETKIQSLDQKVIAPTDSPKSINSLPGNFNNEIKLFFSDIDGTLLPFNKSIPKGIIPQSVIEGKKELDNAKIPLILVTGRSSREALLISNKIGIQNQFIVAHQGAQITNSNGELIYEDGIPSDIVKKIVTDINSYNKKNNRKVEPFIYINNDFYMFDNVDLPYLIDKPTIINSTADLGKKFNSVKIGLYSQNPKALIEIQKHLAKKYPKYNVISSADCYCDITSKTATKGNAIKLIAKKMGIKLKNVAVIGDAENDISMLSLLKENEGLAIAVDNANSKVKSNANYITTSSSNNGFLNAVTNVLKNNIVLQSKIIAK